MSPASAVDTLVASGRLVVLVGPGGVGKTTLAAALAVRAAMLGRHTFVLTIDPARRLASALGIAGESSHGRHVRVPLPASPHASSATGSLTAAMLDPRTSYDALIGRIASATDRDAILENRVYRAFSRTLARSHAYVAMEHLHDVLEGADAPDLVVLDTPPLRSALDVLDAPLALARFAEHRVAVALAGGALGSAGAYAAGRLVGLLAGQTLGDELSTFLRAFLGMRAGFADRARRIDRILREEARFVLAMAPDATHVADARHLVDGLEERGIHVAATLGNRAFTEDPRRPLAPMPHLAAAPNDPLAQRALSRARALATRDEERRALVASFPGARFVFPRTHAEPIDVAALHALALAGLAM